MTYRLYIKFVSVLFISSYFYGCAAVTGVVLCCHGASRHMPKARSQEVLQ